jgi:hypothetical protein
MDRKMLLKCIVNYRCTGWIQWEVGEGRNDEGEASLQFKMACGENMGPVMYNFKTSIAGVVQNVVQLPLLRNLSVSIPVLLCKFHIGETLLPKISPAHSVL